MQHACTVKLYLSGTVYKHQSYPPVILITHVFKHTGLTLSFLFSYINAIFSFSHGMRSHMLYLAKLYSTFSDSVALNEAKHWNTVSATSAYAIQTLSIPDYFW